LTSFYTCSIERGSLLDEYEEWDGDNAVPLEKGDILFRNDDRRYCQLPFFA